MVYKLDFVPVPELKLAVSRTLASDENGQLALTWYEAKLWCQENRLVLLTDDEFFYASGYLRQINSIFNTMGRLPEFTDTVVVAPDLLNIYPDNIEPKLITASRKVISIDNSHVLHRNGAYIVSGGVREDYPNQTLSQSSYISFIGYTEGQARPFSYKDPIFFRPARRFTEDEYPAEPERKADVQPLVPVDDLARV